MPKREDAKARVGYVMRFEFESLFQRAAANTDAAETGLTTLSPKD